MPEGGTEVARKVVSEDRGGQLGESLVGSIKALFYEGWGRWLVGEGPVVEGMFGMPKCIGFGWVCSGVGGGGWSRVV